jgi:hypothetical protein
MKVCPAEPPERSAPCVQNAKMQAMQKAQELNDKDKSLFEHNVEILQHNQSAKFYVLGKSAMGQGDTAFMARRKDPPCVRRNPSL